MKTTRSSSWVRVIGEATTLAVLVLAASASGCTDSVVPDDPPGGGAGGAVSPTPDSAPTQETVDPPPPTNGCDYTEASDATNDYFLASGYALEATGLTFSGTALTVCGQVDSGHYSTHYYSVDIDNFGITLASDSDVIVTLSGAGQNVSWLAVHAYNPTTGYGVGSGNFINDHGVFSAHLAAGRYELSVEAYDNQDIAAPIPYKMRIAADAPGTRCPQNTSTPDYVEANDGASNRGNDVIDTDYRGYRSYVITTSTADAPEPTSLVLVSGASYRISGTSAAVSQTDATTNQLAIRLNWTDASADLDYLLFPEGGDYPYGGAAHTSFGGDEFATIAVAPGTRYWLWVGALQTSTVLPATYDLSLHAETFTP